MQTVGHSDVITIPKILGLEQETEFESDRQENGTLLLTLKQEGDEMTEHEIQDVVNRFSPLMNRLKDM